MWEAAMLVDTILLEPDNGKDNNLKRTNQEKDEYLI